jgi:hypothetical protein
MDGENPEAALGFLAIAAFAVLITALTALYF